VTPRHEIADIKLIAETYGFAIKGTTLEKHKGGADRLDQLRPSLKNCELASLSNCGKLSPASGV
jgi:hypothetical protein